MCGNCTVFPTPVSRGRQDSSHPHLPALQAVKVEWMAPRSKLVFQEKPITRFWKTKVLHLTLYLCEFANC